MAEYVIQDSTLTSIGDAIRKKTGGSSAMTPAEMVTAIGSISGGADLTSVTSMSFSGGTPTDLIEAYAPDLSYLTIGTCKAKKIVISGINSLSDFNAGNQPQTASSTKLEELDLNYLNVNLGNFDLRYQSKLTTAKINVVVTGTSQVFMGTPVKSIRFQVNKTSVNIDISAGVLDNDSLVSLANGIVAGSHSITLHANAKAALQTIVGTVSQITDDSGTYDFFTQDQDNGTVTLMDFVTNTKGWTVA